MLLKMYDEHTSSLEYERDAERAERLELQDKLFKVLRVPEGKVETKEFPRSIHGVVSPMKQRRQMEDKSRKEHFAEMAKKVKDLPPAIQSETK